MKKVVYASITAALFCSTAYSTSAFEQAVTASIPGHNTADYASLRGEVNRLRAEIAKAQHLSVPSQSRGFCEAVKQSVPGCNSEEAASLQAEIATLRAELARIQQQKASH